MSILACNPNLQGGTVCNCYNVSQQFSNQDTMGFQTLLQLFGILFILHPIGCLCILTSVSYVWCEIITFTFMSDVSHSTFCGTTCVYGVVNKFPSRNGVVCPREDVRLLFRVIYWYKLGLNLCMENLSSTTIHFLVHYGTPCYHIRIVTIPVPAVSHNLILNHYKFLRWCYVLTSLIYTLCVLRDAMVSPTRSLIGNVFILILKRLMLSRWFFFETGYYIACSDICTDVVFVACNIINYLQRSVLCSAKQQQGEGGLFKLNTLRFYTNMAMLRVPSVTKASFLEWKMSSLNRLL